MTEIDEKTLKVLILAAEAHIEQNTLQPGEVAYTQPYIDEARVAVGAHVREPQKGPQTSRVPAGGSVEQCSALHPREERQCERPAGHIDMHAYETMVGHDMWGVDKPPSTDTLDEEKR